MLTGLCQHFRRRRHCACWDASTCLRFVGTFLPTCSSRSYGDDIDLLIYVVDAARLPRNSETHLDLTTGNQRMKGERLMRELPDYLPWYSLLYGMGWETAGSDGHLMIICFRSVAKADLMWTLARNSAFVTHIRQSSNHPPHQPTLNIRVWREGNTQCTYWIFRLRLSCSFPITSMAFRCVSIDFRHQRLVTYPTLPMARITWRSS